MERYKKLFLFILSWVIIYMILTRFNFLPSHIYDFPTKKLLKSILGLIIGVGALIIYNTRTERKVNKPQSEKPSK